MKRALILLAAAVLIGGCSEFDDPTPEEARVVIDGDAGKTIRLIISTKFVAGTNEFQQTRVEIFVADTVAVSLPYSRTYRIDRDQRFFVESARLETDLANVNMQVYIDGRKVWVDGSSLVAGRPLRFVYMFNQTVLREIVVI